MQQDQKSPARPSHRQNPLSLLPAAGDPPAVTEPPETHRRLSGLNPRPRFPAWWGKRRPHEPGVGTEAGGLAAARPNPSPLSLPGRPGRLGNISRGSGPPTVPTRESGQAEAEAEAEVDSRWGVGWRATSSTQFPPSSTQFPPGSHPVPTQLFIRFAVVPLSWTGPDFGYFLPRGDPNHVSCEIWGSPDLGLVVIPVSCAHTARRDPVCTHVPHTHTRLSTRGRAPVD